MFIDYYKDAPEKEYKESIPESCEKLANGEFTPMNNTESIEDFDQGEKETIRIKQVGIFSKILK